LHRLDLRGRSAFRLVRRAPAFALCPQKVFGRPGLGVARTKEDVSASGADGVVRATLKPCLGLGSAGNVDTVLPSASMSARASPSLERPSFPKRGTVRSGVPGGGVTSGPPSAMYPLVTTSAKAPGASVAGGSGVTPVATVRT